ncbi:MFS transporter [Methylobacterium organophilum]|uniref:MFS transporter n=1 Tax=Methylobacterium organophilum TaxID=410 RepID=UPI001F144322|nr:MFS transporter [Methylobacterium organophilum]UMY17290.1 MFS transporter [Methylobacterium organophilum]
MASGGSLAEGRRIGGRTGRGLPGFLLLFAALYGAYGALSPFLPAFLRARGLSPASIADLLAAAMLVRLVAGPLAGRIADRRGAARPLLALALVLSGSFGFGFLAGHGFGLLLALALLQAVATAPVAPLADALALPAAAGGRAFEYGWVRAAGSAAFILASAGAGRLVEGHGHEAALVASGALFLLAALAALRLPVVQASRPESRPAKDGVRALLALPRFRRTVLAAALVIGAHALHDAFAVIVWAEQGIAAGAAGLLWAESVAAEVAVFLWLGPWLLGRLGPPRVLALAALAGALRWAVQAETAALPVLAAIQLLHGLTFAALHLACLALIEAGVPATLRATALAVYGTLGLGLASALVTLAAGRLYAAFGAQAFLAMSALSLAAVPLALSLRGGHGASRPGQARLPWLP